MLSKGLLISNIIILLICIMYLILNILYWKEMGWIIFWSIMSVINSVFIGLNLRE